ncbi:MAG: DapH/DapD/GlmU-related protein, partial [Aeromonas salmonicida]
SNHNYDEGVALPYDNTYVSKDVIIEDQVWLGRGVTILSGVKIGEGAIIQAGSVVVSDIPKCAIAGGHPAKVFKYRDLEHYERLKEEGQFC